MSTSSKLVEKSQTQQIRTLVESMGGDKLIYLVWVEKENKKIKNKIEERLLCVTKYRIITFKGTSRSKICQSDHLYNLQSIVYQQEKKLELHFDSWFIKFRHPNVAMLVKQIWENVERVCCWWPERAKPKIDANSILLTELNIQKFDPTEQHGAAGFLATYYALCSLHMVEVSVPFLTALFKHF